MISIIQRAGLLTAAFIAIVTIICNIILRNSLYLMGEQLIEDLQSHSIPLLDWFFFIITTIVHPTIVVIIAIGILIYQKNKQRSLIIFIFIIANTYLAATFKAYYKDPRPIWSSQNIRNIGFICPLQYGNPSGHSWFSVILGFGLLIQYKGLGKMCRNLYISLSIVVLVPLSRMYLGAHSLNQVLQGVTYGLVMCILFSLWLKQQIAKFLWNFRKNNMKTKVVMIFLHLFYIIGFIIGIGKQIPEEWDINITKKCLNLINQKNLNFYMFTFNAVLVNLFTGIAFGYQDAINSDGGQSYLIGKWYINQQKYELKKGKIYYMAIQLVLLGSGLTPAIFLSYILKEYLILTFIIMNSGAFISGYLYTKYTSKFLYKWKIIEQFKILSQYE